MLRLGRERLHYFFFPTTQLSQACTDFAENFIKTFGTSTKVIFKMSVFFAKKVPQVHNMGSFGKLFTIFLEKIVKSFELLMKSRAIGINFQQKICTMGKNMGSVQKKIVLSQTENIINLSRDTSIYWDIVIY